ncbi:DgyrCDS1804 [Dimorphilus gyrociliatus]|uniref:DgyrCDS1804 n=1 Tax=Dimorphilus gyrociliatus TaxID=2664684 RepID=A0A7I8V8B6_9ANNE|nr:DgyrCDS1804 [Dimorphilus gyrociliatus]
MSDTNSNNQKSTVDFDRLSSTCRFCLEGCKLTRAFLRLSWTFQSSKTPSSFVIIFKPADDPSSFSRFSIPIQELLVFDNKFVYYFTYDKPVDTLLLQIAPEEASTENPTEWLRVNYKTKEISQESLAAGDGMKI